MDNLDRISILAENSRVCVDALEKTLVANNFKPSKKTYADIDVDGEITVKENNDFAIYIQISIYKPMYIINKYDKKEEVFYTLVDLNNIKEVIDYLRSKIWNQ